MIQISRYGVLFSLRVAILSLLCLPQTHSFELFGALGLKSQLKSKIRNGAA